MAEIHFSSESRWCGQVPAGWFVVFDTCIWVSPAHDSVLACLLSLITVWCGRQHVALPNTSESDRVGTIAGFNAQSTPMAIPPPHLALLESEGSLTPCVPAHASTRLEVARSLNAAWAAGTARLRSGWS